jgi:hypothetical protein
VRSPMCSWSLSAAAALAFAGAAPAQSVRPPVTVQVRVEGPLYWRLLGDASGCGANCSEVKRRLQDSVRVAFERQFGFLDWHSGRRSPDTVVVVWTNTEKQSGALDLRVIGRRPQALPTRIPFETFTEIAKTGRPWTADAVTAAWATRLRQILRNPSEAQLITRSVLAQIRFEPLLTLGSATDVMVDIGARALRADPRRNPSFLARLYIVDPKTGPGSRQDSTEVQLISCSRAKNGAAYACRVGFVAYPERTPPDTLAAPADLAQLARRASRQPVGLHIWTFFPADTLDDAPIRPREE